MKGIMTISVAAGAISLLILAGISFASTGSTAATALHFTEPSSNSSSVDVGKKGLSQGDYLPGTTRC